METLLTIALGIGLAAACGFRIFVPPLVIGLAAQTGHLELAEGFRWMASTPALIVFGSATLLEVAAYYIPFFDNLLDTVATPSAVVAGVVVTASQVTELSPLLGWSIALVAGGGAAGAVQGLTTVTRGLSSVATGGFANPLLATVEAGGSLLMTVLAIVAPLVAVLLLAVGVLFVLQRLTVVRSSAPA